MKINKEDWDDWARKAQAGDKDSYRKLLNSLMSYIRAFLYSRISQKEHIDDLIQDILMGVHKSMPRYLAGEAFSPWLHAIIRFKMATYLASHYKDKNFREAMTNQSFEEAYFLQNHEMIDLEKALEQLDKKQAQLFRLLKIEGLSVKEVARKVEMSESAVKVSLHRTIKKLRAYLEK